MAGKVRSLQQTTEEQEKLAKDAEERKLPPVHVVFETIRLEGEHEISRTPVALAFSGLAAGLSMGFSMIVSGLLRAYLPEGAHWRPLVANLGYTTGFLIVILGRQQLFTENTLTPILPMLKKPDIGTIFRVMRLWVIVLAANVVGCAVIALILTHTHTFTQAILSQFAAIGDEAYNTVFWTVFWRAFFGGWLIALMVWLIPASEGGAVAAIVLIVTYIVGLAHFSHIIAGSVDALFAVFNGSHTPVAFLTQFFVPTLFGNIVGGLLLVALLGFAQVKPDSPEG